MNDMINKILKLSPCIRAKRWLESQKDAKKAWVTCERGDWMMWLLEKLNFERRLMTRIKVEQAKIVEHLMTDQRSIDALRASERYADGEIERYELDNYAAAAYEAAAAAAADDYAAYGAYAAYAAATAYAAYAAYAAAYFADADAALAVANAADNRQKTLKKCADIVREHVSFDELADKLQ